MSELSFSDGQPHDEHFIKNDEVKVAFLNHVTTRLDVGRLARRHSEGPMPEVIRLPHGPELTYVRDLEDGPKYHNILRFEHALEPVPDMLFESEQIRARMQGAAFIDFENVRRLGLGGDQIFLQQYQTQMLRRQNQAAMTYGSLFDSIKDDGHELWLRLKSGPGADPALSKKIIMAKFALLDTEYWDDILSDVPKIMVSLVPKIHDKDTGVAMCIPEQLMLSKQWLYIETDL